MQAWMRHVLQQTVAVVVSARRWIVVSVPVLWVVTGVIFHFSLTWLWGVIMGMFSMTFLMVWLSLNAQHRHISVLSRKLHHLERTIKQREEQRKHAIKKMHRGQHNGKTG